MGVVSIPPTSELDHVLGRSPNLSPSYLLRAPVHLAVAMGPLEEIQVRGTEGYCDGVDARISRTKQEGMVTRRFVGIRFWTVSLVVACRGQYGHLVVSGSVEVIIIRQQSLVSPSADGKDEFATRYDFTNAMDFHLGLRDITIPTERGEVVHNPPAWTW